MKTTFLMAALAFGLGACRQSPTAPAAVSPAPVRPSAHLSFASRCTSVWDISVDGKESGLLLFTGPDERYDAGTGSGAHLFSATRWAPSDIVLDGALPAGTDTVIALRC